MKNKNYHSTAFKSVLIDLNSNINGLSEDEVKKRILKFGYNKLPEQNSVSRYKIFLNQFRNPLIYIMLFAAFISFIFKEFIDMYVILFAVFLNSFIGYFQENKANTDLSKLRHYIKKEVFVKRNSKQYTVNTNGLVPGDIIFLQSGTKVPADCRIIESNSLLVDEAVLTGESIPVEKSSHLVPVGSSLGDRKSMIYMGTTIVKGNVSAVIVATGLETEIGKIAGFISQTVDEDTPLQTRLKKLSRTIGILVSIICVLLFIAGILLNRDVLEMLLISIAVAVSSIPEGLPVAITVVLTIGMQNILKDKSLVRRLVAAETLGSTTVICMDKTGTLTLGKMKVSSVILNNKEFNVFDYFQKTQNLPEDIFEIFKIGVLCNDAFLEDDNASKDPLKELKIMGSPTDKAILLSAMEMGISLKDQLKKYPKISEVPFDSLKKYMLTLHRISDNLEEGVIFCKGAPEIVLSKCKFDKQDKNLDELIKISDKFTIKGLRLIAFAKRNLKIQDIDSDFDRNFEDMTFLGFIALKDPLRIDAKSTIDLCLKAGIRPIIITGDHKLTAKAIAIEIGMDVNSNNILTGDELDEISDLDLRDRVKKVSVYVRVSPHHKLRIVKALQENGEVVAMTGDGINDAPAIQIADIGIALGSGTDIAKETAEIIILDDNFSTIVNAIKQGRIIFENIKKIITYVMSDVFSEILLMIGSIIFGLPIPLVPAQILWINIVNEGFPNFALAFEKSDKGIMKNKPIPKDEPLIDKEMKFLIFVIGVFTDIGLFTLFFILLNNGYDLSLIRTYIFTALGINSLIYVYSCKNLKKSLKDIKIFDNKVLVISTLVSFMLLLLGIYLPFFQKILRTVALDVNGWIIMGGIAVFEIVAIEFGKWIFIHKRNS
ncbi:MAG: HAD-IC family P-type ATPase [Patescibacteria group bacterium]|nr:HAD-IC family P-type ATPase [Patescibacteria group bacterium]MDD4304116.1 HAD-IC family P-type ATPase [Patescibacteria group bacterium]MDD4694993.1 HAD-IC family P-type ATPase [Patescibacteria group bacterium]